MSFDMQTYLSIGLSLSIGYRVVLNPAIHMHLSIHLFPIPLPWDSVEYTHCIGVMDVFAFSIYLSPHLSYQSPLPPPPSPFSLPPTQAQFIYIYGIRS